MISKTLALILFLAAAIACPANAVEKYNMRRCLLLPVTDSAGNSLGFKVYENLEGYLKSANWCDYVSSAELIEVFSKYREGLEAHLKDQNVLSTVAQRLQAGSIIRLDLDYEINQVTVQMDVVGENGADVYFSEKTVVDARSAGAAEVAQTAKAWLELYESSIPYDGKVLGILGDQVTFSYPEGIDIHVNQDFRVRRLVKKSKHPLLKKVVEWDTDVVARGKVFNLNNGQALGNIRVYERDTKLKPGDWVVLEDFNPTMDPQTLSEDKEKANQFGKLGFATLYLNVGKGSVGTNTDGSAKAAGLNYGFSAEVEAWVTRQWFITGEIGRRLGGYEEESGDLALESVDFTAGVYKIGGGYKHLPMGFFYGPQVNLYAGFANYTYNVEESREDGFGQNSISGIYLGVGGNMPLKKGVRIFGNAEFMPFSKFSEEDNIFGSEKSSSSLVFEGGVKYQYGPLLSLDAAFEVINNSAKFDSGNVSQVSYRDTLFKIGGAFIF